MSHSLRLPGGLAALALLLTACPAPPASEPADDPTYELVATRVLSNCTTRSCHGSGGGKGGLVLTPDQAYAQLVGVPAANEAARAKGKLRVAPGNPEASFLYQKLTSPAPDEGARMPYTGPPLAAEDLALVRRWIAAGAPRQPPAGNGPAAL